MRIIFASIVIAPLMLIGALPAAQSISSDARIRLATGGSTADRDTYNQKARNAIREWQKKLHDFSEKAKAKGQGAGDAATDELNTAWTKIEAEEHKLRSASAEDWESAKISFEKASRDLKEVWDKIRPNDKWPGAAELAQRLVRC
jgi:hypothetical protein